jgi:cystathionine beta-lyase/cystathionine gamma-synthase
MNESKLHLDTLAIHAGQFPDPVTGAVMPPISLSTTFAQDGPGAHKGFEYARTGNPTRNMLEDCVAALESGKHGLAFASGCAAMTTLLQTLRPGDHVVSSDDVYGGSFRIFDEVFRPAGVHTTQVDLTVPELLPQAFTDATRWVWVESPTNPMLKVVDIARIVEIAHGCGVRVAVDNTFATPCLQRPLELGADAVIHSTTKYMNGHSDVVGGMIVTSDAALAERLRFLQNAVGAVPSPFDCYLVLRGIKTLPVRVERHCRTARALASWLARREDVVHVIYPGLASHPQHELAARQMADYGGMISFEIRGGIEGARRFLAAVRIFVCAESLGGVESLIEHPAIMTHGSIPKETREQLGIRDGFIRVSVGLEDAGDLQRDLERGFAAVRSG